MKRFKSIFILMLLMLLALPTALRAENAFYTPPFNIIPGDTKSLSICLDNDQIVRGIQADIILPEGLSMVKDGNGDFNISLTDRASSFSVSSNEISNGTVRVLVYSFLSDNLEPGKGTILKVQVKASESFTGGYIQIKNIILADENNQDVDLADSQTLVGIKEQNTISVADGEIESGEGGFFSLNLLNDSQMTACQFDVILPTGLSLDLDKSQKTERWSKTHLLKGKDYGDGRVRILLFSSDNKLFNENDGSIWNFWINADKEVSGKQSVKLDNIVFSDIYARTYKFSPILFSVEVKASSVSLNEDDNNITIRENENKKVNVNVARTMIADGGWYTLCLPFDIDDVSTTPLKDAEIRKYKSMTGSVMNFEPTASLKAMHAYLVKPTSNIENPVFEDVTVVSKSDGIVDGANGYEFVGVHSKHELATDGTNLFLGAENKFYIPMETDKTMKALRGYFIAPSAESGAKMGISIDGETTYINGLANGKVMAGKVYNLCGQYVGNDMKALQKGVYVVNGRKYIIK